MKKFRVFALILALITLLSSCSPQGTTAPAETTDAETEEKITVTLCGVPLESYSIVYPEGDELCLGLAENLKTAVLDAYGISLGTLSDASAAAENEIRIGLTAHEDRESIKAIDEKLGSDPYGVFLLTSEGGTVNVYGRDSVAQSAAADALIKIIGEGKEDIVLEGIENAVAREKMSAMSFNVWVGSITDKRKKRVVAAVEEFKPDTVGFQEVSPVWYETLKRGLSEEYDFVGTDRDGTGQGEANPIFFRKDKFTLLDHGTEWLSETPEKVSKVPESSLNRIYTWALLKRNSDGVEILVVNTHFDHTSAAARTAQAKYLLKFLEAHMEYPLILTGDFNAQLTTEAYANVAAFLDDISTTADDAYVVPTFTNYGATAKYLDYIFAHPDRIHATKYLVYDEKVSGDYPSDHYPVYGEYVLING